MLVSDVHQSDSVIYSADGKDAACNTEDVGLIPGSGRSPGEGSGYPLQYSCLGNSMGRGAWWATVHGITKESDMTEKLTLSLFLFQILFPFRFYIHLFWLFRLWIFSSVTWRNNYSHRDFSKKSMRKFTERTYPRLWHQIRFKSTVVSSQGLQTEGRTTVCRFLGTVARNLTLSLSPVMIQASFNSVVFIPEYWIQVSYQFSSSGGSAVKNPLASTGDVGLIPGLGRSPGGGNGSSLQYYCLGNSVDRGTWRATVSGGSKSQTRLST